MKRMRHSQVFLYISFLEIGCGGPGLGDDSGALGELATLHGTIENWTVDAGITLIATISTETSLTMPHPSASIATSGAFTIELPRGEDIAPYLLTYKSGQELSLCTSLATSDPPEYKSGTLMLRIPRPIGPLLSISLTTTKQGSLPQRGDREVEFRYVDRDVRITGETRCDIAGTAHFASYDYYLHKGWNTVITDYKEFKGFTSESSKARIDTANYSKAAPSDMKWMKSE